MKRFCAVILSGLCLLNFLGCAALIVGAAGGAGTAAWLSGKLSQEINAPRERVVQAAKTVLASMNLTVTKEERTENVTSIRSVYTDGRDIWIDVHPLQDTTSRLEIRVGVTGDKTASEILLKKISDNLGL